MNHHSTKEDKIINFPSRWTGKTPAQLDGRSCIDCGRDLLPLRPTGETSPRGGQLFTCCGEDPPPDVILSPVWPLSTRIEPVEKYEIVHREADGAENCRMKGLTFHTVRRFAAANDLPGWHVVDEDGVECPLAEVAAAFSGKGGA